ncbi:MAG TPA: cupredoxin domain-containing protein [Candidatus Binataceae bacterium]|nr:cupredoxin domain-containing protein [Candidatus Binataceae bacterium]
MMLTRKFAVIGLTLGLISCAATVSVRADETPQIVKISASKYQFTPDHITLVKGEPVTLELTSTDRTHGFMIRALKIDSTIEPGRTTSVTVTPDVVGNFKAICDHYCGPGHGGMKMTVVVAEKTASR